jgi:hypothetical protein
MLEVKCSFNQQFVLWSWKLCQVSIYPEVQYVAVVHLLHSMVEVFGRHPGQPLSYLRAPSCQKGTEVA